MQSCKWASVERDVDRKQELRHTHTNTNIYMQSHAKVVPGLSPPAPQLWDVTPESPYWPERAGIRSVWVRATEQNKPTGMQRGVWSRRGGCEGRWGKEAVSEKANGQIKNNTDMSLDISHADTGVKEWSDS